MNRTLILAVLLTTGLMVCASTVAAGAAPEAGGCVEPVPQRSYESDRLVYSAAVDYTNCDWWPGDDILLEASLTRLDGQGEAGAAAFALCGKPMTEAPTEATEDESAGNEAAAMPSTDPDVESAMRSGTCAVAADLEHPPTEAALYRGQVTYPWEGGNRTVTFAALCGPGGGCVDLPADPSPALAVGSDLYEQLVGGEDDAR